MPRGRSRSPSASPDRSSIQKERRSRSPLRDTNRPRRKEGGFRWKEKPRNDEGEESRDRDRRLERGYRERYRARSPHRRRDQNAHEQQSHNDELALPKKQKSEGKEKKAKGAATAPASEEPMIIVNVNDRLGTKAAIPCYASDPINLFKAQVAARIGRGPHEILLKRQGERPFKDQLTLEDYGVSNGVQLDLELDTGD